MMAFFKSFQNNLPSVSISSILDSVTSRVDDLANAVSDVTYAVSDQLTEQVTTIISKVDDGENAGSQESGQTSATQEGKAGKKSIWPMSRESEPGNTASKTNEAGDATEAEYVPSQLEWEWRDGCWRVKKTDAELAEEERRRKEEEELWEKREQRRKERRARQLEREAKSQRDEEEGRGGEPEEEAGDGGQDGKATDGGDKPTAERRADDGDEPPQAPDPETGSGSAGQKKQKEEEEEDSLKGEGDEEEEAELPKSSSTAKKKGSEKKKKKKKKKGKDAKGKSEEDSKAGKKKEKGKKSKKKKKGKQGGAPSDSEEDRAPEAEAQQQSAASAWSSERKQWPPEGGGCSSEASSEQGEANGIQRRGNDSSLGETKPPPPYRAVRAAPRSRVRRRASSSPQRCSGADEDADSCLNKGGEEDIPSDSTAVLGQEDGSGPRPPAAYEPEPLAKYGTLDVAFEYDSGEQHLSVTVTAATDIPAPKQTGNIAWQVHLVLLPAKKQRAKTGVQKGPCPVFAETFKFSGVEQEALGDHAVRFRLYSVRRMKKERVLGETVFPMTKLNPRGKMALPVTLEPRADLTGCGSLVSVSRSAGALSYRSTEDSSPEILLGLLYNSATGQLSAEVIEGSHFKATASDKPVNGLFCCLKQFVGGQLYVMRDTYVKLTMLDSKGKEMSRCKTAACRGQPNPAYKETFVFQVALFQLSEVSLVLSVLCRRSSMGPRERLGRVSLGLNSTGEEQQAHWTEMREAEGRQVCHWHTLTDA